VATRAGACGDPEPYCVKAGGGVDRHEIGGGVLPSGALLVGERPRVGGEALPAGGELGEGPASPPAARRECPVVGGRARRGAPAVVFGGLAQEVARGDRVAGRAAGVVQVQPACDRAHVGLGRFDGEGLPDVARPVRSAPRRRPARGTPGHDAFPVEEAAFDGVLARLWRDPRIACGSGRRTAGTGR
jgi:hypothetical protein